jgi:hypothetical protein
MENIPPFPRFEKEFWDYYKRTYPEWWKTSEMLANGQFDDWPFYLYEELFGINNYDIGEP